MALLITIGGADTDVAQPGLDLGDVGPVLKGVGGDRSSDPSRHSILANQAIDTRGGNPRVESMGHKSLNYSLGEYLPAPTGRYGSILLKKSGLVLTTEKYASEIEFLAFRRSFQTRISRSSV